MFTIANTSLNRENKRQSKCEIMILGTVLNIYCIVSTVCEHSNTQQQTVYNVSNVKNSRK